MAKKRRKSDYSLTANTKTIPQLRQEKPTPEGVISAIPIPFATQSRVDERLLNDDTVYSIYNLFCSVVLGSGWRFEGDDADKYEELTGRVTEGSGFPQMLNDIAAAPFNRYSVTEIIWQVTGAEWMPTRYRPLPPDAVYLEIDEYTDIPLARVTTTAGLQELPIVNALISRWRPNFKYPTGQSFHDHMREILNFKRRADEALIRYIERFGAPTVLGWYAPGMTPEGQGRLLSAIKNLQAASYGVLPGPHGGDTGNDITILEPKGSEGGVSVAMEMIQNYERRMARCILGSVLAVFESQFGTRAQADTHYEMLKAVVRSYQADVEQPINRQLIKQVLRYNADPEADVIFRLNPPAFNDPQKTAQMALDLVQAGVIDPEEEKDAIRKMVGI